MSAFVVSAAHINYLVSAAVRWTMLDERNADATGTTLLTENVKSVDSRYRLIGQLKTATQPFKYRSAAPQTISPVQVLKGILCLEYQSDEHDGWETSAAKKFLSELKDVAISKLEGYNAVEWSIS